MEEQPPQPPANERQNQVERQQEFVLRAVEERGVRLIRLWFTDVLGKLKSVAISPVELETALAEGVHFDGSAIDGFSRVQESDVLAKPDATTFELLPWADEGGTARMFCDIFDHAGNPHDGDPRHVLRRNLAKAPNRATRSSLRPRWSSSTSLTANRPTPQPCSTPAPISI